MGIPRIAYNTSKMENNMINELFKKLADIKQIEAIALEGSRSGENYDNKSDYDVYIYSDSVISEKIRTDILKKYCSCLEIGNHYWEYEDNCILNDGTDIDIIYRDIDSFCKEVSDVVEKYRARNGYTTCMWHNLLNCKIIYDKNNRLAQAKKRFSVPYPEKLRENIIKRNCNLLYAAAPAYLGQIQKACTRNDKVSVIHRTAAFLESYFDIIFALNRLTHPGEKRLIELCIRQCTVLPDNFEADLNRLFDDMPLHTENLKEDIDKMIFELKKII